MACGSSGGSREWKKGGSYVLNSVWVGRGGGGGGGGARQISTYMQELFHETLKTYGLKALSFNQQNRYSNFSCVASRAQMRTYYIRVPLRKALKC